MATRGAIAELDKVEQTRRRLLTERLAKRLGVEGVKPAERVRQPELQRVFEDRAVNDFLEGLDGTIKDEGYTAAAGQSLADQKAAEQEAADAAVSAETPVVKPAAKATKAKA
jgi:hypothetical protein